MTPSWWKCRSCGTLNQRVKQRCVECLAARPKRRRPAHLKALDVPYSEYVRLFGDRCGICGATGVTRNLHRDHFHTGPHAGKPRGVLCFRCNTALPDRITADWLLRAHRYLMAAEERYAA